jgi:hypothetical protein
VPGIHRNPHCDQSYESDASVDCGGWPDKAIAEMRQPSPESPRETAPVRLWVAPVPGDDEKRRGDHPLPEPYRVKKGIQMEARNMLSVSGAHSQAESVSMWVSTEGRAKTGRRLTEFAAAAGNSRQRDGESLAIGRTPECRWFDSTIGMELDSPVNEPQSRNQARHPLQLREAI